MRPRAHWIVRLSLRLSPEAQDALVLVGCAFAAGVVLALAWAGQL